MKALDAGKQYPTTYCIPLWLRDEQIRANTARVKGRIQPGERRDDAIAIVCYGPSLASTWEQIRGFRYVMTCSGAHRFLVERGIIPTHHVEVDPRAHKVELIGPPQAGTEYLIASTCSAAVLDHLEGFDVKLWHVFDNSADGTRLLPAGEYAITGGCDVGLRSLTIAGFLGFRDLHVFGMDHSAGRVGEPASGTHAADHPNGKRALAECEVDGVRYLTTQGMLVAAQQVWHELDQMPAVRATFYGDGLCQAMSRNYRPKPIRDKRAFANVVAFSKPELISPDYRALNAQLHRENLAFGVGGGKHAPTILKLLANPNLRSVLDYGCGKGYLAKALAEHGIPIWEYDPAIPGKDEAPRPADIVACLDVLEHIEPDRILFVLDDLRRCVKQIGYFVIHTGPSGKTLADGRNAHILQRDRAWWERMLRKFFHVAKVIETPPLLHVVVSRAKAKPKPIAQAATV